MKKVTGVGINSKIVSGRGLELGQNQLLVGHLDWGGRTQRSVSIDLYYCKIQGTVFESVRDNGKKGSDIWKL